MAASIARWGVRGRAPGPRLRYAAGGCSCRRRLDARFGSDSAVSESICERLLLARVRPFRVEYGAARSSNFLASQNVPILSNQGTTLWGPFRVFSAPLRRLQASSNTYPNGLDTTAANSGALVPLYNVR